MVRYASIASDGGDHHAGRGGVGVVMGSENLQAVIVRGEPIRPTGDLERLYREYAEAYRNHDTGRWLRAGATIESLDFASFGTNDPTQYTLAVDRNNEHVADRFDELHPAILKLIGDVIDTCRKHDVDTSICGQAGSKPEMVQFLAKQGVTSISANIDAVRDVQHEVKRAEQKLLLDS